MFLVGLTGGISTGKSLVAKIFEENGVIVIDADLIARQIVEPGQTAYNNIIKSFGKEILDGNGKIDRKKLGDEIFNNPEKRVLLNSLTHPWIYGSMKKQIFKCFLKGEQFVVLELPLLYETRSVISYLHKTVVVTCDEEAQLERLMARNSLTAAEAKKRIDCQMPLHRKTAMADIVIENSGSILSTRKETEKFITLLRRSQRHIRNRFIIFGSFLLVIFIVFLLAYKCSR